MARQKLKNYYDKNRNYAVLKELLGKNRSDEDIAYIWQAADKELKELLKKHKNAPKGEQHHLTGTILPCIAMHKALRELMPDDEAVGLMDKTIEISGMKVGETLNRITSLPGMEKVFMKLFAVMVKRMFGEQNGFRQVFYEDTGKVLRFDITKCPYYKYSLENDCGKIAHTLQHLIIGGIN